MLRNKNSLGKIALGMWFVVGIVTLRIGDITRWQYFLVWLSNIVNLRWCICSDN